MSWDMRNTSVPKPPIMAASSVVYIGSIPYDWDENIIKSVICGSGKVVEIRLGFDYAGKNKGFCFVEYQTRQDAQGALGFLAQIKLVNGGQVKKLRIESSKEGFLKSNAPSEQKPVLQLDKSYLPNYVVLPDPVSNSGGVQGQMTHSMGPIAGIGSPLGTNGRIGTPPLNQAQNPAGSIAPLVPLKFPPPPQNLQLAIPDKINETLSKIPPAQLIELISTLKNILNGPDSSRAFDVFKISPHLATTAAQALLLMGFIDGDVISDAMKTASAPPPQVPTPIQQQPQQQPQAAYQNNFAPPNLYGQPPSKWPHLPPATQAKLVAMPSDQAELIAQVLSLPADQISSLPIDKQRMVIDLRGQYL